MLTGKGNDMNNAFHQFRMNVNFFSFLLQLNNVVVGEHVLNGRCAGVDGEVIGIDINSTSSLT